MVSLQAVDRPGPSPTFGGSPSHIERPASVARLHATDVAIHAAWLEPAAAGATARLRLELVAGRPLRIVAITTSVAEQVVLDESTAPLVTQAGRLATCLALSGDIRFTNLRRPLRHGERVSCLLQFDDGTACHVDCTTREDWLRAARPRQPRVILRRRPGPALR